MDQRVVRIAALGMLCAMVCAAHTAQAVNLVPNESFETYTSCPTAFGQIYQAVPWDTPNTGTSDYFNPCAPATFPSVNAPATEQGFQNALTGVAYAGLIPYSAAADYREYIQAPLSSPLVASTQYLVKFHVSLGDISSIAVDRLGAYLSVGPVGPIGNYAPIAVTPQVETPANVHLTNSTGWTLVSGIVVASGGENHIVIGSFHDDASTSTVAGPGTWPGGAYYFIEDVSVELYTPAEEACCVPGGGCSMQFPGECAFLGGTSAGPGTTCTPDPCEPTAARPGTWGALKTIYR